jgi:N-acetylglutamate synthase-like GNAT family acetyltransferase
MASYIPNSIENQKRPERNNGGINIRTIARSDLDRVGEILFEAFSVAATQRGYAPRIDNVKEGVSWAWAVLRHGPNDVIIAEIDNYIVGVCCLNKRGMNGGVGPVAVDPKYHGNGIGHQLMTALIRKAEDLKSVRLFQEAFNPASFSLYYSLDFMPVAELLDLSVAREERQETVLCSNVQELKETDLDDICMYDHPRSTMDRRPDLAYYSKWGKVFIYRDGSQISGYLACLPGLQSVQLGPLVSDNEEYARDLFGHAMSVYSDHSFQTRVMARDRMLVRALKDVGFKLYCVDLLMVRGEWRPDKYIEAFGRFPEGI